MTFRDRFGLLTVAALLTIGPVYAQSDINGALPQSDVSGNLTQSDLIVFQSDEVRIRMNDVAATLSRALQNGSLGSSAVTGGQQIAVSPMMNDLFGASSRTDKSVAAQALIDGLTAQGLPPSEATTLARAVTGLLNDGTVSPPQFMEALNAFNAAVNVAPTSFLLQPPHDFVVVRGVLMSLLEGTI